MALTALVPASGADGIIFTRNCEGEDVPPADVALGPIARALRYLALTQRQVNGGNRGAVDFSGDWPQCFSLGRNGPFVRDVSPFMVSFIFQGLRLLTPPNAATLRLTEDDLAIAKSMRAHAIDFMVRFMAPPKTADADTIGFWPSEIPSWRPGDRVLEAYLTRRFEGPQLMGYRTPLNLPFFPADFAIPSDADDTAAVYMALLDSAILGEGPPVTVDVAGFFSDWRDIGKVPQRNQRDWIPPESGAFLTWLAYRDDPVATNLNDVDPAVNANVLNALGRLGRLDTPGVTEAVDLLNNAITTGRYLDQPDTFSLYYPDNLSLHYFVARAYAEGGVGALQPAATALVSELIADARRTPTGDAYWDHGDPHLNTAFAVLTLLYAAPEEELIPAAVQYLIAEQDQDSGAWDAGVFFVGHTDGGDTVVWSSRAFTAAIALEALCRYELEQFLFRSKSVPEASWPETTRSTSPGPGMRLQGHAKKPARTELPK